MSKTVEKKKKGTLKNATTTTEENGVLPIVAGKVSVLTQNLTRIRPSTTVTTDILTELISATSIYDAVDVCVDKTPFGKMALSVYSTLTNPDGEYIFTHPTTGKRTKRPEKAFEAFCRRRWMNSDAGIEAVYDMLTRSIYTRGDMALEVVVSDGANDIDALLVIDPSTFSEFNWIEAENRYGIYQRRSDQRVVDLYTGNFIRFPYQPNINNPVGTVPFEPAIAATIDYYQHLQDATVILNRIGYPRYKMTIDEKAVLEMANNNEKSTPEARNELFESVFNQAQTQLSQIGRDSDIISFSSNVLETIGGGVNGSGVDVRAWFEVDATAVTNAYSLPRIYLNLEKGGSYALGTAEQEALVKRIDNSRDNIVAIKEAVANLFCRVMGYNAVCKFNPDPLEWEKLEEKWNAKLLELQYHRRTNEYGYVDPDISANALTGEDKAFNYNTELYEYIKKRFIELDETSEDTDTTTTEEGEDGTV